MHLQLGAFGKEAGVFCLLERDGHGRESYDTSTYLNRQLAEPRPRPRGVAELTEALTLPRPGWDTGLTFLWIFVGSAMGRYIAAKMERAREWDYGVLCFRDKG